jgi:hypothetical protein
MNALRVIMSRVQYSFRGFHIIVMVLFPLIVSAADDDPVVPGLVTSDNQPAVGMQNKGIPLEANIGVQIHNRITIDGNTLRPRLVRFAVRGDAKVMMNAQQVLKDTFLQKWQSEITADVDEAVEWFDQTCQLSESQKHHLWLAGQADRRQFLRRMDEVRKDCLTKGEITNQLSAELDSLRRIIDQGALGPDSFFVKALRKKLTSEQLAKYRQNHLDQLINSVVSAIDNRIPVQPEQRDALDELIHELAQLIQEESSIDGIDWLGWHDHESVHIMELKYRLSLIAEEKLKPLFNEIQWRDLQGTLEQFATYDGYYRNAYLNELNSSQLGIYRPRQRLNRPAQMVKIAK